MKKIPTTLFLTFLAMTICAQTTETIYSWESPSGTITQTGGTLQQHNDLTLSRINYPSSGYYTIQLCGKKESMEAEDNTSDAVYFTITLADDKTFKADDEIEITAMRNNDDGGKASIHFLYGNGTTYDETNTWANLGDLHETSFSGGTEAKSGSIGRPSANNAGTEPLQEYSLEPSTNTFSVPVAADGSATLSLTRNESECKLYITKIVVTRSTPSSLTSVEAMQPQPQDNVTYYNLSGQQVTRGNKGIIILNGKKIIRD